MANEKHDSWALLREAREVALGVMRAANHVSYTQWTPEMHRASIVLRDIDAALAAREAEERVDSATPVVEWVHREGSRIWSGGLGNAMFDVVLSDDGWKWVVVRERESGVCNTLDEAQRAALAAARGMR